MTGRRVCVVTKGESRGEVYKKDKCFEACLMTQHFSLIYFKDSKLVTSQNFVKAP